jgi:hypothetical protein
LPPQLEDDLGAADVGQHPIDEDEVWTASRAKLDRLGAIRSFDDFVTLEPAHLGDQCPNVVVVLDDEDALPAPAGE